MTKPFQFQDPELNVIFLFVYTQKFLKNICTGIGFQVVFSVSYTPLLTIRYRIQNARKQIVLHL